MNHSPHLPGNPYALHGAQGGPEAQALLALAYEIRTLVLQNSPYHDNWAHRLQEAINDDE